MKKKIIPIVLILIAVSFFVLTYKNNIIDKSSEEIKSEINGFEKKEDLEKNMTNILKNVTYENYDEKGNFYEIKSDTSESYQDKPNESLMKNVTAKITLFDSRIIIITSDFALYNRENNNTNFFDNVVITETNNKIASDKLDFVYTSNMIFLRDNIVMNNSFGTVLSDMVDINLNEGIAKIYMTDKNEQVKVNYKEND
tara:strand:- start:552 stop:1145 length:594 start_codon:yes stop_codon:yes gene_type:complete